MMIIDSVSISTAGNDIKPTMKILKDDQDRIRPEIFSNARVPGENENYCKIYTC